jgi:hypothetical protein
LRLVVDVSHEPALVDGIGLERPAGVHLDRRDYLVDWTYAIPAQSYLDTLFEKRTDWWRNVVDTCDD